MLIQADQLSISKRATRSHVPARPAQPIERPLSVTIIALFQFAKASLLLLTAAAAYFVPEALQGLPALPSLIYFAAHGRDTHGFLLPLIGIYVAVMGWGLWSFQRWARRSLVVSSGLMLIIRGYRFVLERSSGAVTLAVPIDQQTLRLLLFLDAVVFVYLVFYDDVLLAFAERH